MACLRTTYLAPTPKPSTVNLVSALAMTPDGKRLVTVTDDGQIRIWETAFGNCLSPAIHVGSGIDQVHLAEAGKQLIFRVAKEGWFSLPMPPESMQLPLWFLDLAEGIARRRLTSEGKTQSLTLEDQQRAADAIPKNAVGAEATALRWARWLLTTPDQRPLSPQDDQNFEDYMESLKMNPSPAAAAEVQRLRPRSM